MGPRVVLVRHGETEWSRSGRHTGRTDLPLTEAGRKQAKRLAPALAAWDFTRVLASPLRRARETCALAGLEARASLDADLCEWDYGDYEGLTTAEIRARAPGWRLFADGCPGGEAPEQVAARADRVVGRLREAPGDAVVFAHGHVLRVLAARWLGLEAAEGAHLALDTGTLGVLGWEHEAPALRCWNAPAHGAPTPGG